jgi:hypothetical protein
MWQGIYSKARDFYPKLGEVGKDIIAWESVCLSL